MLTDAYATIRWNGTPLATSNYHLDIKFEIALPFAFRFHGVNYTTAHFCSNGWFSFGADPGDFYYFNTTLPTTAMPNAAIYPFWDDLVLDLGTWPDGQLLKHTTGTSPNRVFIVEWHQLRAFGTTTDHRVVFQIKLYETSNAFEILYDVVNWIGGASFSATIGYENADGTQGGDIGTTFIDPPTTGYRCVPGI